MACRWTAKAARALSVRRRVGRYTDNSLMGTASAGMSSGHLASPECGLAQSSSMAGYAARATRLSISLRSVPNYSYQQTRHLQGNLRSACGSAERGRGFKFRQIATSVPRGTVAGELGEGRFEYRGIVEAADENGNDFRGHLRSSEKQTTAVWAEVPVRLSTASAGDGADPGLTVTLNCFLSIIITGRPVEPEARWQSRQ